ncbi:MAG: alanine dehydrogenase, partial [Cytophagales bacterium]|nr:alanine dehydrogenase [Cytophagales bacterium]
MKETLIAPFPKEVLLEKKRPRVRSVVGMPKEDALQENRICLTPGTVEVLCKHGHEVRVEKGAGEHIHFSDSDYVQAGARIVNQAKEAFEAAIVVKVAPPTLEEIDLMSSGTVLVSAIQVNHQTKDFFLALGRKKISAIGFELLTDEHGEYPIVRSMSEIAGNNVLAIAAEHLSAIHGGPGISVGGITGLRPTRLLIIGSGTVAECAARSALGIGASVEILDNNMTHLRRIKYSVGQQISTRMLSPEALKEALPEADILIMALRLASTEQAPIITKDMVKGMKEGAMILEISIDTEKYVETSALTSHDRPVFIKHGVIH